MRRFNGWMTIFWIIMVPVSILTGWVSSVPYVASLSIYALITGHLSTWQASRVEVKQEESDPAKKLDEIHEEVKS